MPTYYQHFGLDGPPFDSGSSLTAPFLGTSHRAALDALESAMAQPTGGFTLLVGESGTGKTTLVKGFLAQHPEPASEWGDRAAIIVDEAEDLSDANLEDLWRLANFEAKDERRLHFLLVARPELLARLETPALRNVFESIGARATLNPLTADEAQSYVDYWMQRQGGSAEKIFERRALAYLIADGDGIPRRINILCDRAMRAAYERRADTVGLTDARAATAAYRNLRGSPDALFAGRRSARLSPGPITRSIVAAAVAVAAVAAVAIFLPQNGGWKGLLAQLEGLYQPAAVDAPAAGPGEARNVLPPTMLTGGPAGGAFAMPPSLEPTTLRGFTATIPEAPPLANTGAASGRLGPDQGDAIEQPMYRDLGLEAGPKQQTTDATDSQADEPEQPSPEASSALTPGSGHTARRHYRRPKDKEETTQEMATNEDRSGAAAKPARPQVAKTTRVEPRIQSLDPNWWVVPSR